MNKNNMAQVFAHYIDNFAKINDEVHEEYYKWQICYEFPKLMDKALGASDEEFPSALYKAKVCSCNIIDSFTQPFYGLVKLAEEEPDTVRKMFLDLYAPDNGDLMFRMKKIEVFFDKSNELLEKYYPGSYLYKQNSHSVSSYLFLYDPEQHYMYKASECTTMADCIGFYDSWGTGDNIKLDVFYRMCDEMLEQMNQCPELLKTNESRYGGTLKLKPGLLHPDRNKHILLFDIIYCCKAYDLFGIIPFARPNTKEKQLILEQRSKVKKLQETYELAKFDFEFLEEALEYLMAVLTEGTIVKHKKFGNGRIEQINKDYIWIHFLPEQGTKRLGLSTVVANGIVSCDNAEFVEKIKHYRNVLAKAQNIPRALDYAARALRDYEDFL